MRSSRSGNWWVKATVDQSRSLCSFQHLSLCAGVQLLLQQPTLAQSLAPPGTPSIEQYIATQQPGKYSCTAASVVPELELCVPKHKSRITNAGSMSRLHNFRQLNAPNLTLTLSEEGVNSTQQPESSASQLPSSQSSTPSQQDTQVLCIQH